MKRLLISGFVAVALLAVATTLRSHSIISTDRSTVTTGVAVVEEISGRAGVTRLPIREFGGYVSWSIRPLRSIDGAGITAASIGPIASSRARETAPARRDLLRADALLRHVVPGVWSAVRSRTAGNRLRRPDDVEPLERFRKIVTGCGGDAPAEDSGKRRSGTVGLLGASVWQATQARKISAPRSPV
jgi:hypothetical protein